MRNQNEKPVDALLMLWNVFEVLRNIDAWVWACWTQHGTIAGLPIHDTIGAMSGALLFEKAYMPPLAYHSQPGFVTILGGY